MRDTLAVMIVVLVVSKGTGLVDTQARGVRVRCSLHPRTQREWKGYIRPIFRQKFYMEHRDFMVFVELLRPRLERNARMGALRNGAVPIEWQVALEVAYLAGGSMHDLVDQHYCIGRTTA